MSEKGPHPVIERAVKDLQELYTNPDVYDLNDPETQNLVDSLHEEIAAQDTAEMYMARQEAELKAAQERRARARVDGEFNKTIQVEPSLIRDKSGLVDGILRRDSEATAEQLGVTDRAAITATLHSLAESDFTGGNDAAILSFDVPTKAPDTVIVLRTTEGRKYTIVNLINYGGNDHCNGEPNLDGVGASIANIIDHIDAITEGGQNANGDVADYGTGEINVDGSEKTVRKMKLDADGASRVPMYAVYDREGARNIDSPRILVLAQRTTAGEHEEIKDAMNAA